MQRNSMCGLPGIPSGGTMGTAVPMAVEVGEGVGLVGKWTGFGRSWEGIWHNEAW